MSVALKIIDQVPGARPRVMRELRLASERATLRQLLKHRIDEEVAEINAGKAAALSLVTPEERRGAGKKPTPRPVDAERQLAAAVEAFERRRIVVIVGRQQILDLDEPFGIEPGAEVTFLKLVPLVGG